jgi:hypothetical protein
MDKGTGRTYNQKVKAEQIIKKSNLDWSIFRLSAIMGNHKMTKLMFHQPLETSFEITTPEDAARAFVNALEAKPQLTNKIFNLGGGKACRTSYRDFSDRSFQVTGLGDLAFSGKAFAERNFHIKLFPGFNICSKEKDFIPGFNISNKPSVIIPVPDGPARFTTQFITDGFLNYHHAFHYF